MASNFGYFPWGAEDDPRAPFNNPNPKPIAISVMADVFAKREFKVLVDDYRINIHGNIDVSPCDLDYASDQQHYGLLELMDELRKRVEKELAESTDEYEKQKLKCLLDDTQGWSVDYVEYDRD